LQPDEPERSDQKARINIESVDFNKIIKKPFFIMKQNSRIPQGCYGQTVIINQVEKKSNGIGTAGLVLALLAVFLGWIPILGWILWLLGLIFSFIGIFKSPRGMAIAGLVISLAGILLLIAVYGVIFAAAVSFLQ